MERNMGVLKEELRTDPNLSRAKHYAEVIPEKLPSATKQYLLDKVPIIQWLPKYSTSWLVSDFSKCATIHCSPFSKLTW